MSNANSRQGIIAGTYAIKLGRTRIQHAGEDGRAVDYIMKHGDASHAEVLGAQKKVHDLLKRKERIAGEIKTQCRKAKEEMEGLALPEEEGPYADAEEKLAQLADVLNGGDKFETIEHVMDIIRPFDNDAETEANFPREYEYEDLQFFIDGNAIEKTEGLVTAGTILAEEEERRGESKISGAKYTIITDYMEAIIIAVGVLRNLDIQAYPALAVALVQGREVNSPVIAVLEPESENPLITFNLMRNHPPVAAVHLISDTAMLGATYALKAVNEAKKFSAEMVEAVDKKCKKLSGKEVEERIDGISGLLFECHKRWKDSPAIETAMRVLGSSVYNAVTQIEAKFVELSTGNIKNANDQTVREIIQDAADKTSAEYVAIAAHKLQLRIAKETAKEEAEKQ